MAVPRRSKHRKADEEQYNAEGSGAHGLQRQKTGHGFRGLASTVLHEKGHGYEHIELQPAPAPRNAVSATNNHALYLATRAKMMPDFKSLRSAR